ncbi:histone-lysine N-methyltransferase SETD1B [Cinnamomum micranthum f. kanehirae]|uniref:Histone-lysine N-methyltransferase SETD1B n=1 Tax=Cinnamomum micranthum f. kanehirae TaxID=337451 RepID=A0A3S4NV25_9MAGN|nr:histone-lysine N-methyltransferase SETD1B [Cinnamomum micranthum f. kanehirae]
MQPNSILALSPSFSSYSSHQLAEIAAKVIREIKFVEEEEEEAAQNPTMSDSVPSAENECADGVGAGDDEDDFEFTFVCQDPDGSPITADEVFSNGQIRPIYPIFNRDLILEHEYDEKSGNHAPSIRLPLRQLLIEGREPDTLSSSSSASSESETLEGVPAGTYCVWTPRSTPPATPNGCKKSNSTGSSKRWRFRDLLHRSSSDGKETFVFLSTAAIKRGEKEKEKEKEKGSKEKTKSSSSSSAAASSSSSSSSAKGKAFSAHEMHYVKNRAMRESDRHRSYLPYRKDIVGFFANVNGLSKSLHPF